MTSTIRKTFYNPDIQWICILALSLLVLLVDLNNKELNAIHSYYASISKSILERNEWLTLYDASDKVYANKPPLVFWLSAISLHFFGMNSFGAIFPIAIFAFGCIFLIKNLSTFLFDKTIGYFSSLVCLTTFLFIQNSTSFRMEPALLFGILLSITSVFQPDTLRKPILFFTGILISVLAKGPTGFLPIIIAPLCLAITPSTKKIQFKTIIQWALASIILLPIAGWYLHLQLINEIPVIETITKDALAQRVQQYSWPERVTRYYATPLVLNYWPWLPFLILGIIRSSVISVRNNTDKKERAKNLFLLLWLIIVFIGASLKPTGYTRYLFPALPPMSILVAREVISVLKWKHLPWWIPASSAGIVLLSSLLLTCTPFAFNNNTKSETTIMRNIISQAYPDNQSLPFLTTKAVFQGDIPLWVKSWSHFYLDKDITPIYLEDIKDYQNKKLIIALTRKSKNEAKIEGFNLITLVKSRHYELVMITGKIQTNEDNS